MGPGHQEGRGLRGLIRRHVPGTGPTTHNKGGLVRIRDPKDFWAGFLFLVAGLAAIWLARDYPAGTALRMGPGYFPTALGGLLSVVGLAGIARACYRSGAPVPRLHGRLLAYVLGATLVFGLLILQAGLIAGVFVFTLVGAAASVHFRWRTALLLAGGLALFSVLVFVKALGLPIPLVGPWLGG